MGRWRSLFLVVLAIALYAPNVKHPFVIDDLLYIADNPAVVSARVPLADYFTDRGTATPLADVATRTWRPLRTLLFRAIAVVTGGPPWAFALVSLAFYAIAGVQVFFLLLQISPAPEKSRVALLAAAAWVAAPVHIEAVLYASALGDQMSLVFELGALSVGLAAMAAESPRRAALLGATSLPLFACALLSKEAAITGFALLGLLAVAWLGSGVLRRKRLWIIVGAQAVVALGLFAARTHVLGTVGQGALSRQGFLDALTQSPVLMARYMEIMIAPLGHHPGYVVLPSPAFVVGIATAAIGALVAIALLTRSAWLWLGIGFVAASLAPVLHLVPLLAFMADRFALLPSVGVAVMLSGLLVALPPRAARIGVALAIAYTATLAAGTLVEGRAWRSDEALWRNSAQLEPRSGQAHSNLATALLNEGRFAEALSEMQAARNTGFPALGLAMRGAVALDAVGKTGPAEAAVRAALADDGTLFEGHALLGDLLARRGALGEAEAQLAICKTMAPTHPSTQLLAARVAWARGRRDEAIATYRSLAAANPSVGRFHYLLAQAALDVGDGAQAIDAARRCLALAPSQPQCLAVLGLALAADPARREEARAELQAALRELPEGADQARVRAAVSALPPR